MVHNELPAWSSKDKWWETWIILIFQWVTYTIFTQTLFSHLNSHRISTKSCGTTDAGLSGIWGFVTAYLLLFPFSVKCQGYFIDDYELSWVMPCDSEKYNDKKGQGLTTKALLGHVESFVNSEWRWAIVL